MMLSFRSRRLRPSVGSAPSSASPSPSGSLGRRAEDGHLAGLAGRGRLGGHRARPLPVGPPPRPPARPRHRGRRATGPGRGGRGAARPAGRPAAGAGLRFARGPSVGRPPATALVTPAGAAAAAVRVAPASRGGRLSPVRRGGRSAAVRAARRRAGSGSLASVAHVAVGRERGRVGARDRPDLPASSRASRRASISVTRPSTSPADGARPPGTTRPWSRARWPGSRSRRGGRRAGGGGRRRRRSPPPCARRWRSGPAGPRRSGPGGCRRPTARRPGRRPRPARGRAPSRSTRWRAPTRVLPCWAMRQISPTPSSRRPPIWARRSRSGPLSMALHRVVEAAPGVEGVAHEPPPGLLDREGVGVVAVWALRGTAHSTRPP